MTPWQEFYNSIRDPSWPDCNNEKDFDLLPDAIKKECQEVHGYTPGEYAKQSAFSHRVFPINTATACQLKWNWSTIFLTDETTASCHRTNHHKFDLNLFDFHNTPSKVNDRLQMLDGKWPESGCEYCQQIEASGGQSDRITNLDMPGIHAPHELEINPTATHVTPRILEVYFDNTCNLKCVYCGPQFSSLWEAENKKHGTFQSNGLTLLSTFKKSPNIEENKKKIFEWLKDKGKYLTNFNILGGDALYQQEFDQCLDLFQEYPAPDLDLQIFTNLNTTPTKLKQVIEQTRRLIDSGCIRNFTVTASLDCWGKPQEYARFPLDLIKWEQNFLMLLEQPWIKLIIGSTITPVTVHTLDQLIERINNWNKHRPVYHYFNSVNSPSYMFIDIFGSLFIDDFNRCLDIVGSDPERANVKKYLEGIAKQSASKGVNRSEVIKLQTFLNEMDRRRGTNWQQTFPWLVDPITTIIGNNNDLRSN